MFFKVLIALCLLSLPVIAQQEETMEAEWLNDIMENIPEYVDLSELNEYLIYLRKHPLDLNRVDVAALKQVYFLSPLQIAAFFSYREKYGKFSDVLELQAIEGFDMATIRKLLPFVQLSGQQQQDPLMIREVLKKSEHDWVSRFSRTLEKQKGYAGQGSSTYQGTPDRLWIRYKFQHQNILSFSIVTEKDAGEKHSLPFDFLSAHLILKQQGIIDKLVIGDYHLQFGQGLTLWSGFGLNGGMEVTQVVKNGLGLKPSSSSSEYGFLRGVAMKLNLRKSLSLSPFWSLRKLDASIEPDENGQGTLSTISETGYHRTSNEIKNAYTLRQLCYGLATEYTIGKLNTGLIAYHTQFDKRFVIATPLYKQHSFTGKELNNFGFFFNYHFRNIFLFGELAKSYPGKTAVISGFLINLSQQLTAAFVYRHYPGQYFSFFQSPIGEAGGANEKGAYTALNFYPHKSWIMALQLDAFSFPWLKYRVDAPSEGYKIAFQNKFTPNKHFEADLKYRYEKKQQNADELFPINIPVDVIKESYRLQLNWDMGKKWHFQSRIEFINFRKENKKENGRMIYQDISFQPRQGNFKIGIRIGYFHTSDYDSRIYAYENDVLYQVGLGMYQGKGWRSYLNTRFKLSRKLQLWSKYGFFYYPGKERIGSNQDEIEGAFKSEIKVQLRYHF